jgi:hypothetical protein
MMRAPRITWTDDEVPVEVLEIRVFTLVEHRPDESSLSMFCGQNRNHTIRIPRSLFRDPTESEESAFLAMLPAVPLKLADDCKEEYLVDRGWKAYTLTRGLGHVVYNDPDSDTVSFLRQSFGVFFSLTGFS